MLSGYAKGWIRLIWLNAAPRERPQSANRQAIDPLRPAVPAAIRAAQRAGLQVGMITGDHPATALAILLELGIAADPAEIVIGAASANLADDPAGMDDPVADMILSDDNFASIVAGIEEGRIAYDNVRKVVFLLVSTGAAVVGAQAMHIATMYVPGLREVLRIQPVSFEV